MASGGGRWAQRSRRGPGVHSRASWGRGRLAGWGGAGPRGTPRAGPRGGRRQEQGSPGLLPPAPTLCHWVPAPAQALLFSGVMLDNRRRLLFEILESGSAMTFPFSGVKWLLAASGNLSFSAPRGLEESSGQTWR